MAKNLTVAGADKWGGDPAVACHRIELTADDQRTATESLAPLLELLSDPDELARIIEHAREVRRRAALVRSHDADESCDRCAYCGAAPHLAESFGA